jgi:hypothetical protein
MLKICNFCKTHFESEFERQIYCSTQCRTKFHNQKNRTAKEMTIICVGCNESFVASAFIAKRKKYCSGVCFKKCLYRKKNGKQYSQYKPRSKSVEQSTQQCISCNADFTPKYSQCWGQKFCNADCKANYHTSQQREKREKIRKSTIRQCPICDTQFSPKKSLKEIYCSKRCREYVGKKVYKMMQSCYEATKTDKADQSHKVLGYTPSQLLKHLQTFPEWERLKHGSWHLDHVFPIVAFVRKGIKDVSLICRLDNLQPLPGARNCSKGDDYDEAAFEDWLSEKFTLQSQN